MMKLVLILFFFSQNVFSDNKVEKKVRKNPINFFIQQNKKEEEKYSFNQYENIISGVAAFSIGNIGYIASENSVLKLTYSAIQTIGIINVGKGIYQRNSPSVQKSFYKMLAKKKKKNLSKYKVADNLIETFAKEERAKRLSLFYSTGFLSLQYILNATIYDSPDRVKNIYIFLGGVNAIIAAYSGLYKGDYESYHFGEGIDINPFALKIGDDDRFGANLTYSF